MTTKKLVPRASGEGAMGVDDNAWGEAYYDTGNFNKGLFVSGHNITQVIAETVTQGGLGGEWTRNGLDIYYNGGNVGIGTTSPSAKFEVKAPTMSLFRDINNVGLSNGIQFKFGDSASTAIAQSYASIGGVIKNNTAGSHNGELAFSTAKNGNLTIAEERMRIDSDGNVGIGTTDPICDLDINGTLMFSTTPTSSEWMIENGSTTFNIKEKVVSSFIPRLTLLDGGNVGIGTTNPESPLTIKANPAVGSMFKMIDEAAYVQGEARSAISFQGTASDNSRQALGGIEAYGAPDSKGGLRFLCRPLAGTTAVGMVLNEDSNVGIGTTNPNQGNLMLYADEAVAQVFACGGTDLDYRNWAINAGGTTKGALHFQVGDSVGDNPISSSKTKVTFDKEGNVGIGTTAPNYRLTVEGVVDSDWISRIYNKGTGGTAGNGLLVRSDATNADNKSVFGVHADGNFKFLVKSTGNVGIGTTNPGAKLDVRGNVKVVGSIEASGPVYTFSSTSFGIGVQATYSPTAHTEGDVYMVTVTRSQSPTATPTLEIGYVTYNGTGTPSYLQSLNGTNILISFSGTDIQASNTSTTGASIKLTVLRLS